MMLQQVERKKKGMLKLAVRRHESENAQKKI